MNRTRRQLITGLVASMLLTAFAPAHAAEVTFRFHQFLPPQAAIPSLAIKPWADKIEKESGGRIKIEIFSNMQLGGKPPEIFDQVREGVVDMGWVVLGYTPGRFPKCEVFELPFVVGNPEPSSRAFYDFVTRDAADEFKDVHLITAHVHGPGLFHSRNPITRLEDLKGLKVRGGSRIINAMLGKLGATPVGMPVPSVGEALSKGVIDAATLPWEVAPSVKIEQIVKNHTAFSGNRSLYTQTFAVVMNKASYDKLPPDLKKVIDQNSGPDVAALFGRAMNAGDKIGLDLARKEGGNFVTLDAAETQRWKAAAASVRDDWFKEVAARGIDGKKLAADAEQLVDKYAGK